MSYKIRHFFEMLIIFLFILTLAITLTIQCYPLYNFSISHFHLEEATGLSKAVLKENYHVLLRYLNFPWIKNLNLPDFPSSPSGLSHFYEVKKLFLLNYGINLVTIVPSFFILRNYFKKNRFFELKNFFKIGMILPILLGFVMALGFDQFFVMFHKILFNNNDWLFDPQLDPVIMALPEGFFMACFILFFVLFEGMMLIGYIWSFKKEKSVIR